MKRSDMIFSIAIKLTPDYDKTSFVEESTYYKAKEILDLIEWYGMLPPFNAPYMD